VNTAADKLDLPDALETAVLEETAPDTRSGLLPFGFSQAKQVVLESSDDGLTLSYVGRLDTETLLEVRRTAGANFALEQVDEATFQARLSGAYQRNQNQAAQMAEDLSSDIDLAKLVDEIPDLGDLMDAEDDAPIIRLINAILSQAVKEQASDIHIETFEDRLSVRYRIDGVLAEVLSPKRMLAPLLVSRLKVMAKLDIAEKRIPQFIFNGWFISNCFLHSIKWSY
jgi:general secretion pathway protein E